MPPVTSTLRPTRSEGLEVSEVADGLVVYQAAPEQVHYLNNTSAVVFELCDGDHSLQEIADTVRDVFSLSEAPIEEVRTCVDDLAGKGVVR
jgi:hypothetical protein